MTWRGGRVKKPAFWSDILFVWSLILIIDLINFLKGVEAKNFFDGVIEDKYDDGEK